MSAKDHAIPWALFASIVGAFLLFYFTTQPSLNRNWSASQSTLPEVVLDESSLIRNIRDTNTSFEGNLNSFFHDESFQINNIHKVWLLVLDKQTAAQDQMAVTFQFGQDAYLTFTAEPRLEEDETYSALKGLFARYELAYFVSNERNFFKNAALSAKDRVYIYEVRTSKDNKLNLFRTMSNRLNKVNSAPEFYNTLFNNGTRNLLNILKTAAPKPAWIFYPAPSRAGALAYDMGLLVSDINFRVLKIKSQVSDSVLSCQDNADFSFCIRQKLLYLAGVDE